MALVGISGFYFWFSGHKIELAAEKEKASEVAVTASTTGNPKITTNSEHPVRQAQDKPIVKLPKYTGQIINMIGDDPMISQLPASAIAIKRVQLTHLSASLSEDSNDFNSWMALGNFKKFFNNFIGARDAWEYAKIVAPNQPLTYLNLANLYGYYLKEPQKAESNFLTAISIDSQNAYGGLNSIANYYKDFGFKDKAIEFYKKALELNPNDSSLMVEIQRLSE